MFTWRREARLKAEAGEPSFVPALVNVDGASPPVEPAKEAPVAAVMEVEIGGAHVWIWRDADIGMATAILRALQIEAREE